MSTEEPSLHFVGDVPAGEDCDGKYTAPPHEGTTERTRLWKTRSDYDCSRPVAPPTVPHGRLGEERDLRPSKTQQKISGRLRSETATRHRYAIRGYLDTARKHGLAVMNVIRDAITGNTWMPALPA